jgi:hypothetical protein
LQHAALGAAISHLRDFEIDVRPLKRGQFTLPHARVGGGKDQDEVELVEWIVAADRPEMSVWPARPAVSR